MNGNRRHWPRQQVSVPCLVDTPENGEGASSARILNICPGGVMLEADQAFMPGQRLTIVLEHGPDALLFESMGVMTGFVRWNQIADPENPSHYHVGVALERDLPRRIFMTEH
ncbi:MAG: PilZ domain-containing protein [Desulfovibrionales bacterium]|nr:PilZ domain-containing protein [Desulfovibrionales bacterium]